MPLSRDPGPPGPSSDPARLPKLSRDELDEAQLALYAAIAEGPRARGPQLFALTDDRGGLEGPFNAMLLSPGIGTALQTLGSAIRFGSALSDRARELAILVVAHEWDSAFERHAHEAVGRAAGLSAAELESIALSRPEEFSDAHEQLVFRTTLALVSRADLTEIEYLAATQGLGEATLFELSTLVGYYATLALQLRIFRVPSPLAEEAAHGKIEI